MTIRTVKELISELEKIDPEATIHTLYCSSLNCDECCYETNLEIRVSGGGLNVYID